MKRGAYIATQIPMENTVNDFWKMIWEYQCRSIVTLCKKTEDGEVGIVMLRVQSHARIKKHYIIEVREYPTMLWFALRGWQPM